GRREDRALLQHVRPAFLFDEDHGGRAQIRGGAGDRGGGGVEEGDGGEGEGVRRQRRRSLQVAQTAGLLYRRLPVGRASLLQKARNEFDRINRIYKIEFCKR